MAIRRLIFCFSLVAILASLTLSSAQAGPYDKEISDLQKQIDDVNSDVDEINKDIQIKKLKLKFSI